MKHAAFLWSFPDTAEKLSGEVKSVLDQGKEVGLVSLIAHPGAAAHQTARALIADFGIDTRKAHVELEFQLEGFDVRGNPGPFELVEP
jgi:hypothetical protein